MTLTAIPTRQKPAARGRLSDMVRGAQLSRNPQMTGIDADLLQQVVDAHLSDTEVAALTRLVRNTPPEALHGLCRNLLDPSLNPSVVAHNTMYLFDALSMSYYYSARAVNYRKVHSVIADTADDLTTLSPEEARDARRGAISRLCVHINVVDKTRSR